MIQIEAFDDGSLPRRGSPLKLLQSPVLTDQQSMYLVFYREGISFRLEFFFLVLNRLIADQSAVPEPHTIVWHTFTRSARSVAQVTQLSLFCDPLTHSLVHPVLCS